MPIKLIQNQSNSILPKNLHGENLTLCDSESGNISNKDLRTERDIDLKAMKVYFDAFKKEITELPPVVKSFKDKMLLAANFPIEDIKRIIDQNSEDIGFFRLYLGINEEGEHILCIAPVDKKKKLITKDGTIYTVQCCGHPPHKRNFVGDPLLGL